MSGIQLTFSFEKGVKPNEIAEELRIQADLFDPANPAASEEAEETQTEEQEETEAEPPKKKGPGRPKKEVESFDEEETEEQEPEEDEEPPAPPVKKAKPVTKDDVNEACKAHARRHSFEETKGLLQKKFKTTHVGKLTPDQYAAVVAVMKG